MNNFIQRYALWIALVLFILLALTLVLAPAVYGQADWDKSTPTAVTLTELTGNCKRIAACYLLGDWGVTFTINIPLCKRFQRPIFYTLVCQ